MRWSTAIIGALLSSSLSAHGLNNSVGRTPAMGWNPYNAYLCDSTESQIKDNAQKVVDLGLKAAGYNYMSVDCGWQGKVRDSAGRMTWDTTRFPSGMASLGTFIHNLGLKYAMYSVGGYFSCDFVGGTAKWLGSLNHEETDAKLFAQWGADYLKYDNCYAVSETDFVNFNPPIELKPHYTTMRDALAATGRPILYAACNWGVQDPARTWPGTTVANSWRMSNDVGPPPSWANILRIINEVVPITRFAAPGGFNDLDMLYVGHNELTAAEQQTHFSFWAAAKSPLFIGLDLTKNGLDSALSILKNPRVIAVNQDPLGTSISLRRRYTDDNDVWAGPLSDGSTVALIINHQASSRNVTFNLADAGFISATAQDLVTGNSLGKLTTSYTTTLSGHGSLFLKLTSGTAAPAPSFTYYQAASGTRGGSATTRSAGSATVVGNVGNGGTLTLNNIDAGSAGGTRLVSIDYINADVAFSNTACSNCREAFFSVNGGAAVKVNMPISSGQSWDVLLQGHLVSLSGFKAGKTNTITISNPSAWAPDFYRFGVAT